jgi:hypothetical protein
MFQWTADSSAIGYVADQDTFGIDELFASQSGGEQNTGLSGDLVGGGDVSAFEWVP